MASNRRIQFVLSLALASFGIAAISGASGQEKFPSKTIEVVSHASPGGGTDTTARVWMPAAQEILGEDIIIVYKQGGAARSAHEYSMSQPADGHVILALTQTHLYTIARGNSPMTIDDMNAFFYQVLHKMADTYLRATKNDSVAQRIHEFGNTFGEGLGVR